MPRPLTRRSLNVTIGSLNPPIPSEAQPAIANTANTAAASLVLRLMMFLIFLAPCVRPAILSPSLLGSVQFRFCHQQVTAAWTLLPSDQPTIGGVSRLPSRIRRVQARRRRSHATPPASTLAGCMPPARHGRTDTLRCTPAPSLGASARYGCASEPAPPGFRGRLRAPR